MLVCGAAGAPPQPWPPGGGVSGHVSQATHTDRWNRSAQHSWPSSMLHRPASRTLPGALVAAMGAALFTGCGSAPPSIGPASVSVTAALPPVASSAAPVVPALPPYREVNAGYAIDPQGPAQGSVLSTRDGAQRSWRIVRSR
ncbi:Hypothetical protein A7982_06168 [Minicystis rosea]|nr:Hypothetical protein A7982_06168 [Minicystis rosea]